MNIQGFQKMTLLDYPSKVACTVFTGGCNLRCPFCHNAGLVRTPTAENNLEREVLEYLSQRRGLLDGVCVTGGEPLLQPDLTSFLQKIAEMGYAVKLDTNGFLPKKLREVLETGLVDYVAMDIKSALTTYEKAVGGEVDVTRVEESVSVLRQSGVEYEFRTTAVKGIHTLEDFVRIARFLAGEKRYYIQRFIDSGNLLGSGMSAFSEQETAAILQAVREYVPTAETRG